MDKNPPANAGDMGWTWSEKIPHALEPLSLCATTTEASLNALEPALSTKRSHRSEKPVHRSKCSLTHRNQRKPTQ